jgi:hypothetical protein
MFPACLQSIPQYAQKLTSTAVCGTATSSRPRRRVAPGFDRTIHSSGLVGRHVGECSGDELEMFRQLALAGQPGRYATEPHIDPKLKLLDLSSSQKTDWLCCAPHHEKSNVETSRVCRGFDILNQTV